jgi:hypothetical protein
VGDKLSVATPERETGDEDFRKFFHESMGSIGFGLYSMNINFLILKQVQSHTDSKKPAGARNGRG